jgi:hypothetical protein
VNGSRPAPERAALRLGLDAPPAADERAELRRIEKEILAALRDIRFGSVEIVIQDSRVVQIERREKVRLDREGIRVPR